MHKLILLMLFASALIFFNGCGSTESDHKHDNYLEIKELKMLNLISDTLENCENDGKGLTTLKNLVPGKTGKRLRCLKFTENKFDVEFVRLSNNYIIIL